MTFKNVLLLYKRSAYKIYFLDKRGSLNPRNAIVKKERKRFEASHQDHYATLKSVSRCLLSHGVRYTECYRGRKIDYARYDLIITVGGDGTFLEAARHCSNQVMIGVNSAPNHSVGRFCIANAANFEKILKRILSKKIQIAHFQRLRVKVDKDVEPIDALNDILMCHQNPAMLCRYYLKIKDRVEEQRSSGIWISTPAGSSGAIHSAGGKIISQFDKKLQYLPRELYAGKNEDYRLTGGVLHQGEKILVTSLMRKGVVYLDGAHHKHLFPYGSVLEVKFSPHPIKTIKL